jgi:hypothetical protein
MPIPYNLFKFMKVKILHCAAAAAHELHCKVAWLNRLRKNREEG